MGNTESEILRSNGGFDSPAMVKSMRDFADQEVEAYKKRILDEIDASRKYAMRAHESEYQLGYLKAITNVTAIINELIDAVK